MTGISAAVLDRRADFLFIIFCPFIWDTQKTICSTDVLARISEWIIKGSMQKLGYYFVKSCQNIVDVLLIVDSSMLTKSCVISQASNLNAKRNLWRECKRARLVQADSIRGRT
eukprot:SM000074S21696  [mRNA]  locus=s74:385770:387353:- [translate_table: standard]